MIFSWLFSVFTGVAINLMSVKIYDQGNSPVCSSYAITTCEQYIWKVTNIWQVYNDLLGRGGLATDGGIYNDIISSYLWFAYIKDGRPHTEKYKRKKYKIYKGLDMVFQWGKGWHMVCVVGYNKDWVVFQNSHGVKFGYNWFAVVRRKDMKYVSFIKL